MNLVTSGIEITLRTHDHPQLSIAAGEKFLVPLSLCFLVVSFQVISDHATHWGKCSSGSLTNYSYAHRACPATNISSSTIRSNFTDWWLEIVKVIANDRLGRKGRHIYIANALEMYSRSLLCAMWQTVRVKCSPDDTVGDLKKLIAAQTGTNPSKIQLKKWHVVVSPS